MSQQFIWPVQSVTATNPSVSLNGATIPGSSTLVGGKNPSNNMVPLALDALGNLNALPLPSGAATEATLAAMSAKLPATLGAHVIAASMAVNIASDQIVPISAASLPLPTGAATEATLSGLSAKIPATLGAHVIAASLAVNIASDQVVPVSASSLPLPSGAATEATLSAVNVSVGSIDSKTPALVSGRVPVDGSGVTQPISAASLPLPTGAATEATLSSLNSKVVAVDTGAVVVSSSALPTGAATEATLSSLNGKVNSDFGVSTGAVRTAAQIGNATGAADFGAGASSAQTVRVILSSDSTISVGGGKTVVSTVRNDYSSTSVTTGAWVQLIASLPSNVNDTSIFDSSGQTMELGTGAAASETRLVLVFPGGNGDVPVAIASGTRISIRAVSATASVGEIDINLYS